MANAIWKKYNKILGKYNTVFFCDLLEKYREYTAHLWLKTTHLGEAKVGSSSQTLQKGCSSMITYAGINSTIRKRTSVVKFHTILKLRHSLFWMKLSETALSK